MKKTLNDIREEYKSYINEKADYYVGKVIAGGGLYHESTCNTNSYGWNKKLHLAMDDISEKLTSLGVRVTSFSKFGDGVIDWDMQCSLR